MCVAHNKRVYGKVCWWMRPCNLGAHQTLHSLDGALSLCAAHEMLVHKNAAGLRNESGAACAPTQLEIEIKMEIKVGKKSFWRGAICICCLRKEGPWVIWWGFFWRAFLAIHTHLMLLKVWPPWKTCRGQKKIVQFGTKIKKFNWNYVKF